MLYIDFETRSYCDLTASGSWRYAQDPTTEILCMAYAFSDTEPKLVIGSELPDIVALHIDMGGIVEAHNAMFERALWESMRKEIWMARDKARTMAMLRSIVRPMGRTSRFEDSSHGPRATRK